MIGLRGEIKNNRFLIKDDKGTILLCGRLINGLYYVNKHQLFDGMKILCKQQVQHDGVINDNNDTIYSTNLMSKADAMRLLHKRLGHISKSRIHQMINQELIKLPTENSNTLRYKHCCDTCGISKSTRRIFNHTNKRAKYPGERFYMDLQGPFYIPSFTGSKYIVGFIDSYSRRVFTYYIQEKSKVYNIFRSKFYDDVIV